MESDILVASASHGMVQIIAPIFSADLLSDPLKRKEIGDFSKAEQVKFWGIAAIAVVLDLGIDAVAVITALNGNINAALATKVAHNIVFPIVADKIKPLLSAVVFQGKNGTISTH